MFCETSRMFSILFFRIDGHAGLPAYTSHQSGLSPTQSGANMQLEAVVRRIKHLTADASAKVLVFSSWSDVLDLLNHALRHLDSSL